MPKHIRPRRSMLYVPGDKPRALEKVRSLPVDGIIIDLEDAVAPEAKENARQCIAEALSADYGARELILRVSAVDCAPDFVLAERLPIHGVLIPKVDSPAMVRAASARTRHPIWCMIETPLGVLRAGDIAAASDRLAGFVAGTNDLTKELRARHVPDRTPLLTSLSLMLLAARAHGLAALDGVHLGLDDLAGFEASCRQGVELGFDGKTLVHPSTIDIANRVFGPSAEEVAKAREIVAAWDQARAEGKGVARIGGAMVEQLHVNEALRVIAMAEAIEAPPRNGQGDRAR
ncbi:CoA ester lyase [Sphingomonas sp. ID1715]|uniref:HpcH/HpaI aldolase/citrate lyase family protein n=1 Tax=Sphingomonas sp. ID1715 TaxID=1656898 RepID=UPI001488FDD2|nr:CoA ester lyase [Sphingomonas sp. ID1715]NNM78702.1 CoA ester lyase [Sphingomonas sp. ID1715]